MSSNFLMSLYSNRNGIKKIFFSIIIFALSIWLTGVYAHEIKKDEARTENKNFIMIGQSEKVIISNPENGKKIYVLAKIDTGADRTSIGTKIAKTLELNLEEANRTVKVISSTGQQKRPLVDVVIQLAGKKIEAAVSVTDRGKLSTKMILGRDALSGFVVNVSQDQITSPKGEG